MARRDERAVTIPTDRGDAALDGVYVAGADEDAVGVVIAAPHPLYGGSMDSPVVCEIALAARDAGLASLRFDWRGVGASAGAASGDPDAAHADYRAALAHLAATVPGAVIAAGYSFGAAAAVRAAVGEPRVRRLLLVSPPPPLLDRDALEGFGGPVWMITGSEDALAPAAELEPLAAAGARLRLEVVPGADHFFATGLADLGRAVRAAFASAG